MRILLVHTFYYPEIKGGAEYSVKLLAEELTRRGEEVLVLVAGKEDKEELVNGVKVKRIKFASIYHSYGDVKKNLFSMAAHRLLDIYNPFNGKVIQKVLDDFRPDIIHTNCLYEITPIIWKIGTKNNIRIVHTNRDYYLECPKSTLLKKDYSTCEKCKPICCIYQCINRQYSRYVNYLTTPSNQSMKVLERLHFFEQSRKVVIPNAISVDEQKVEANIQNHKERVINSREFVFVYLGGLHSHKGISLLLSAFVLLKGDEYRLIFAGKGAEIESVKKACNIDHRITYAGFLNQSEIEDLCRGCDVLVCPSIWDEPFGRVILDAYINGLPVVVSNSGALPELVENGKTGIVFKSNDVDELKNALNDSKKLIQDYDSVSKDIQQKLNTYSSVKQVESFTNLYQNLL